MFNDHEHARSPVDYLRRVFPRPTLKHPPLLNRIPVPVAQVFPNYRESLLDLLKFFVQQGSAEVTWPGAAATLAPAEIAGKRGGRNRTINEGFFHDSCRV
jgi:hypothetical protein